MDERSHGNHGEKPLSRKHLEGAPWEVFEDYQKHYTEVIATLGRECREWIMGEPNETVEAIIAESCNHGEAWSSLMDQSREV